VEAARRLGRRGQEVLALRMQGMAECGQGDFIGALATLQDALALHDERAAEAGEAKDDAGRWERAELFGSVAVVYSNLDKFERALSYYHLSLESLGERFPGATARTLYRMGIAAEEMGDWHRAEAFNRRSLELYDRVGDAAGRALGLLGLSTVFLARDAVDEAEAAARESVATLAKYPEQAARYADALWAMGDVHMRRGRPADALACLEQAHPLYLQTNRPTAQQAVLHQRFSAVYAALGAFQEALHHHEQFHRMRVQHLEEQANARMARTMVQFDTERAVKDREIHRLRNIELEREIAERKDAEAALARAQAELEETNRELHALTIRDPLTGVFNRRYLDQRLAEAMPLASRGVQPLSVMICDVDDFKRINDTWSHAVGDEVLRTVASILRQHVRQSDVVARFGGEEFVVLFPSATIDQAAAASEKVCRLVREHAWDAVQPGLAVTISVGVAEANGHASHEKLLAAADGRLYQAKRLGKNRVVA
jgi:diguanylate cyclase (GGDEF)-like protein